jgi:hypothetical protein
MTRPELDKKTYVGAGLREKELELFPLFVLITISMPSNKLI